MPPDLVLISPGFLFTTSKIGTEFSVKKHSFQPRDSRGGFMREIWGVFYSSKLLMAGAGRPGLCNGVYSYSFIFIHLLSSKSIRT